MWLFVISVGEFFSLANLGLRSSWGAYKCTNFGLAKKMQIWPK